MKKMITLLIILALISACKTHKKCPAYKHRTYPKNKYHWVSDTKSYKSVCPTSTYQA